MALPGREGENHTDKNALEEIIRKNGLEQLLEMHDGCAVGIERRIAAFTIARAKLGDDASLTKAKYYQAVGLIAERLRL